MIFSRLRQFDFAARPVRNFDLFPVVHLYDVFLDPEYRLPAHYVPGITHFFAHPAVVRRQHVRIHRFPRASHCFHADLVRRHAFDIVLFRELVSRPRHRVFRFPDLHDVTRRSRCFVPHDLRPFHAKSRRRRRRCLRIGIFRPRRRIVHLRHRRHFDHDLPRPVRLHAIAQFVPDVPREDFRSVHFHAHIIALRVLHRGPTRRLRLSVKADRRHRFEILLEYVFRFRTDVSLRFRVHREDDSSFLHVACRKIVLRRASQFDPLVLVRFVSALDLQYVSLRSFDRIELQDVPFRLEYAYPGKRLVPVIRRLRLPAEDRHRHFVVTRFLFRKVERIARRRRHLVEQYSPFRAPHRHGVLAVHPHRRPADPALLHRHRRRSAPFFSPLRVQRRVPFQFLLFVSPRQLLPVSVVARPPSDKFVSFSLRLRKIVHLPLRRLHRFRRFSRSFVVQVKRHRKFERPFQRLHKTRVQRYVPRDRLAETERRPVLAVRVPAREDIPLFFGVRGAFRRLSALHIFLLRLSLHAVRHSVHRRLVEDVFRPAVRQADLPAFIRHSAHASARRHEAHGLPVVGICTLYPFSADFQRKLPAFQRQAAALSVRQAVIRPGFPVILYGTVAPRGIAPGIRIPVSARRSHRRHHAACERQRQHLHHKLLSVFHFDNLPMMFMPYPLFRTEFPLVSSCIFLRTRLHKAGRRRFFRKTALSARFSLSNSPVAYSVPQVLLVI